MSFYLMPSFTALTAQPRRVPLASQGAQPQPSGPILVESLPGKWGGGAFSTAWSRDGGRLSVPAPASALTGHGAPEPPLGPEAWLIAREMRETRAVNSHRKESQGEESHMAQVGFHLPWPSSDSRRWQLPAASCSLFWSLLE